ncbi:MAG: XRE family transcriptional regulator [Acidobacteria bacterium]|jgi:predicted XRE-type DNA-binding protein|nr:MAG: XRE family transcriptional regulator [Acidobacteriota bacterium]
MRKERIIHGVSIQEGRRNVYADLGYPDPDDMMVKAQLVTKIGDIIRQRGLTQDKAAELLGLTQPKISKLLKGQFRGVSERRLLRCLTSLGRDVEIVVKPAPRRRAGRLSVLFAQNAESRHSLR